MRRHLSDLIERELSHLSEPGLAVANHENGRVDFYMPLHTAPDGYPEWWLQQLRWVIVYKKDGLWFIKVASDDTKEYLIKQLEKI